MARGVKRSVDSLIAEVDARIKKKQDEISALKERRRVLADSRATEIAVKIAAVAQEKGITLDELLSNVMAD